jgi:hypothetical protein
VIEAGTSGSGRWTSLVPTRAHPGQIFDLPVAKHASASPNNHRDKCYYPDSGSLFLSRSSSMHPLAEGPPAWSPVVHPLLSLVTCLPSAAGLTVGTETTPSLTLKTSLNQTLS